MFSLFICLYKHIFHLNCKLFQQVTKGFHSARHLQLKKKTHLWNCADNHICILINNCSPWNPMQSAYIEIELLALHLIQSLGVLLNQVENACQWDFSGLRQQPWIHRIIIHLRKGPHPYLYLLLMYSIVSRSHNS